MIKGMMIIHIDLLSFISVANDDDDEAAFWSKWISEILKFKSVSDSAAILNIINQT